MKLKYVLVGDLAARMRIHRSTLFKWLEKNDLQGKLFDVRTEASRGQAAKAVTPADAKAILAERERQGWELS